MGLLIKKDRLRDIKLNPHLSFTSAISFFVYYRYYYKFLGIFTFTGKYNFLRAYNDAFTVTDYQNVINEVS